MEITLERIDRRSGRLEEDGRDRERRLRAVEIVLARLPDIEADVSRTAESVQSIREWVEHRDEQREKLTAGQRIAVITGLFGLAIAFLALVGTIISAGVFG